jgi:Flp pilus assembly protein TadD
VAVSTLPGHSLSAKSAGEIDSRTQAEAYRRTGMQLAAHERDEHAIAQLERARELNPDMKAIAHPLGMVLARQSRDEGAFAEFEKAVGPAAAHHNLGLLLIRHGQREQGLEHLQQAAQTDPSLHSASILTQLQSPQENAQPESELASQSRTVEGHFTTSHVNAGQLSQ